MRGMDHLIAQRSRGITPSLVMVDLDSSPRPFCRQCQPEPGERPRQVPQVFVEPGETLARLDLRPLIGLTVFAFGHDAQRVAVFRDAALAAQAARVVTFDYSAETWTDTGGILAKT